MVDGPKQETEFSLNNFRDLFDVSDREDWSLDIAGGTLRVETTNTSTPNYLYAATPVSLEALGWSEFAYLRIETSTESSLAVAIIFLDSDGNRVDGIVVGNYNGGVFDRPETAVSVRFALRTPGKTKGKIKRIFTNAPGQSLAPWIESDTIVLSGAYPSNRNLYRNAFVHTRLRGYKKHGFDIPVVTFHSGQGMLHREFDGTRVIDAPSNSLPDLFANPQIEKIAIHFLNPKLWELLEKSKTSARILVWIHGVEIQPWYRRDFNFGLEAEMRRAKQASETRVKFWRKLFSSTHPNVHFIFVSNYFAEEVFTDLGIRLPEDRYSVIHNPIDTDLFEYHSKAPEKRHRIVSIRPYASYKYANELSVYAVQILQSEPFFDDLFFHFIGDGPLFDRTVEPLRGLDNVRIDKRFIPQRQLPSLLKDYGVLLSPTRWDSQGVSRDEAMASGLVPVTTNMGCVKNLEQSLVFFFFHAAVAARSFSWSCQVWTGVR